MWDQRAGSVGCGCTTLIDRFAAKLGIPLIRHYEKCAVFVHVSINIPPKGDQHFCAAGGYDIFSRASNSINCTVSINEMDIFWLHHPHPHPAPATYLFVGPFILYAGS